MSKTIATAPKGVVGCDRRIDEQVPHPFELVISTEYLGTGLKIYRSKTSGLEVAIIDVESPIVNGYFAVSTEESGELLDKGLPHTLEHLVFLGSEDYPYKGVLDSLANRALAHGTNAWTDVDHTCYTITTAGSHGFKNIMPIYLDHILYPTITDSGYTTEIHHINGNGENAGVVYCEMQGRENLSSDKMQLRMMQLLYPPPSGYCSETGGLMRKLRELDVNQIRKYHKAYYRPDNLRLIITGKVDHTEILQALLKTEKKIESKGKLAPMNRPWVDSESIPPFETTIVEAVEFPDDDESMGTVQLAYHGPQIKEFRELQVLDVLFTYLTDSAISPLRKFFVEIEDPLCTEIDYYRGDHLLTSYYFVFVNVPTEAINEIQPKFLEVLGDIVKGLNNLGLDLERMKLVINRKRLKALDSVETDASETFAHPIICDFLYGDSSGDDLRAMLDDLAYLDELIEWPAQQWIEYIKRYLIDRPHVILLGKPSAALAKKIQDDEETRIKKQRSDLGSANLTELQKQLDKAIQENDNPIPPEMIDHFPPPKLDITFPIVDTARNPSDMSFDTPLQKHLDKFKFADIPYFIQFDDIHSSFINLSLYFDSRKLTTDLRSYIELYLESFFILPITRRDGTKLTHEEVVHGLDTDTVSHSNDCGLGGYNFICGPFESLVIINVKVEMAKYEQGIKWLNDLVWFSNFTEERLIIATKKLLNDIPRNKRDGMKMADLSMKTTLFNENSCHVACNLVNQAKFLNQIRKRLEIDSAEVIKDMQQLREFLTHPENLRIHVAGAVSKLSDPLSPWSHFYPSFQFTKPLPRQPPVQLAQQFLTDVGKSPRSTDSTTKKYSKIISLASNESGYLVGVAKGFGQFGHKDYAALSVLFEYFQTMEGVFWKQIRGPGLAYGASLSIDIHASLVQFSIYRAADVFAAFSRSKSIINEIVSGKVKLEESMITSAKSSFIFSLVNSEEHSMKSAQMSFINLVLKGVDKTLNRKVLNEVKDITVADLNRVLDTYLVPLFNPTTSCLSVVSPPAKLKEVKDGFERLGYVMEESTMDEMFEGVELESEDECSSEEEYSTDED